MVIGNPPYGAMLGVEDIAHLRKGYATATSELDTYGLFIEKATNVCKPQGRVSMIIPTGWYSGVRFSPLRRFVACHTDPAVFVNLPYKEADLPNSLRLQCHELKRHDLVFPLNDNEDPRSGQFKIEIVPSVGRKSAKSVKLH